MPIINEIKHPKKGRKRYKMDGLMFVQKEKTTNKGEQQGEHQQIKYLNLPNCKEHIK